MKEEFKARMLRIHFTEADRWEGKPLHEAIVQKCMDIGIAGAIVFRGIEGFGASARIYHARSLAISKNAPIMVSVIDREEEEAKTVRVDIAERHAQVSRLRIGVEFLSVTDQVVAFARGDFVADVPTHTACHKLKDPSRLLRIAPRFLSLCKPRSTDRQSTGKASVRTASQDSR